LKKTEKELKKREKELENGKKFWYNKKCYFGRGRTGKNRAGL